MNHLQRDDLPRLMESEGGPHITILFPTHQKGKEIQQDPIRLKNALQHVEQKFEAAGESTGPIRKQLTELFELCEDEEFWQHQQQGLALFVSPGKVGLIKLPYAPAERTVVGPRYDVLPLLPLLQEQEQFAIVAVSENDVRVFEAYRDGVQEHEPESLPENMRDVLAVDREKHMVLHSFHVRRGGSDNAVPHGHQEADQHEQMLTYLRAVAGTVSELMQQPDAPVVFAGVEELFPLYKEASDHKQLMPQIIPGNPERKSAEELRTAAWEIVHPLFHEKLTERLDAYHADTSREQSSRDLGPILVATTQGQVADLFIREEAEQFGSFDPESRTVTLDKADTFHNEELYNLAAYLTLKQGGQVVALPKSSDFDEPIAAVYRFPLATPVDVKNS